MVARFKTMVGETRALAKLVVEDGSGGTASFPVVKHLTVIGRDVTIADVVVDDPRASRRHAGINWDGSGYVLEDLGSTNGTTVNGEPLAAPRDLRPGDRIGVGGITFVFEQGGGAVAPESVPDDRATRALKIPQSFSSVPSRRILESVADTNARLGHENLGFISEERGFTPGVPPLLELPAAYAAWDEIAARLPELWRAITVRQALADLPVLDAGEDALPDECLLRASVIISMLAHSYHRISAEPPGLPMPDGVQHPWEQISRRLDRLAPHLSYNDLILYNWKLKDPDCDDPFGLDNLELLVSTVDNQEENVLYLMQVEAHYKMGPLLGAIVRCQEAVQQDDTESLKRDLISITEAVQQFGTKTFMALNPNPYSDTFVDPVVWAKTVAPFAVPIAEGTVGPSGVGAPAFHMLDTFFGRHAYDTHLGKEMLQMRSWYPQHWRDFFDALGEVSVADHVEKTGDPALEGIYKDAAISYAGEGGFLTQHKIKAYGYLDLAFKVGRSVTIGGFSGSFSDRVWDLAVDELTRSHEERERSLPRPGHPASITDVELINPDGDPDKTVTRVVFDVSGTGMRYAPGDRCAVLPENSEELVDKTLAALRADGSEKVTLTAEWRDAVDLRIGHEGATTLALRTLLRFGHIRPVDRATAKILYAASHNGRLRRIIESRAEDQWELWDLLDMLTAAGFDSKRLWKVHPGQAEHICRVVPMESFRMYSISSTMDPRALDGAEELTLTVGRLQYETNETDLSLAHERSGTASSFLGEPARDGAGAQVSLRVVHPPRFGLPEDPTTPIVMFAGGTGIAPFRSFVHERAAQVGGGENWLFVGSRTRHELLYRSEFEPAVAQRRLHIRAAFSRDPVEVRFELDGDGGGLRFEPGETRYIGDEILRDENAEMLWRMLRSKADGGEGAYFYVCGRTGFASSVMTALVAVMDRFHDGPEEDREAAVATMLYELVGEERYLQDIFTTYTGSHIDSPTTIPASDVVVRNNPDDGYWMVIDGRVYDMDTFGHLHPGGFKIIQAYAGMDGTAAYRKVLHHVNPEVDSMLGMYELGVVRRLHFGQEWGTVVAPDGLRSMSLADAYRAWIRSLYRVVEMENALQQDYALKDQTIIGDDDPGAYPPIKFQYLLETHDRFMVNYLAGTTGDALEDLWAVTSGFCSPDRDVRWMAGELERIRQGGEADTIRRLSGEIQRRIDDIVDRGADAEDPTTKLLREYCSLLHTEDRRFLGEIKMALRRGVMVFEEFERDTIRSGGHQLMTAIEGMPRILADYHSRLLSGVVRLWLDHPT
jgi:sulfite reductase alpha subunit-like flavoprotein